uniref:Uncharacterized protein n=1 Tax=Chromera velia CCMP2878 TaxID=1169474 RepID=A0A0G4HZ77_9ALVE|eukprot:Cvel_9663.t1-p1 / transcript=Cvel_9663.t1 / gene=Cvel_9663 / organism=Chromera_velia_CCMP2878 / gene_product=hypothetical protein / transcript_product=hypothetical protein / location=Cvel_scaffold563:3469-3747(-) / protein_length=93 / sequence_SO=supercontig / SO=protein_coding / is_pseudo=false
MQVLLRMGADLHITDDRDCTALHYAALRDEEMDELGVNGEKKLRIVQMLVTHGIDVSALNDDGRTALQIAESCLPADWPIRSYLTNLPQQQPQ